MTANVLLCGYSYHRERFYTHYKHGVPSYLFRLQTEGSSTVVAGGRTYELEQGDLLLLKPGDTYELRIEERAAGAKGSIISSGDYYIGCEGSWVREWWDRTPKPTVTRIDLDEKLLGLWQQIIAEKRRLEDGGSPELTGYLLRALCLYLERPATDTAPASGRPFSVTRMKRFIEEHATRTFRVEEVARHAGLSVSRAVHLFKESYGKTMMEYAQEIRLTAALERMKYTSMTLDQIAETCGFGGYTYFHRVFKEKYGISPGAYRSANGSGPLLAAEQA
ncbi:AraC family transcriptional regulator [Paenibacillus mucilaginosus]|uniref:helix-turn-helix domain-containing protein n=1 Tax=Paenibacillus mucilaginosus TaxID=61624 RepID=UPI001EEF83DB|nr:AraC family transcriptional regulator [Paenibacillus mucilaginosus]MCG7214677.1 AraC family transcriptional regulator [Paenibacillus mucilaginosus]